MKFKDFTQEAYDDIQSYMGGEEQWEEINKTYGVVETKGIFQYDYESQLRKRFIVTGKQIGRAHV